MLYAWFLIALALGCFALAMDGSPWLKMFFWIGFVFLFLVGEKVVGWLSVYYSRPEPPRNWCRHCRDVTERAVYTGYQQCLRCKRLFHGS